MKRQIQVIFVITIVFYSLFSYSAENKYLIDFFKNKSYIELPKTFEINNKKFIIAIHYIDDKKLLIDRGIIYTFENNQIIPYLTIEKELVKDTISNKIIINTTGENKFYGWKLKTTRFNNDKIPEFSDGISITYYSNEGKNVADNISIFWSKKENKFIVFDAVKYMDILME